MPDPDHVDNLMQATFCPLKLAHRRLGIRMPLRVLSLASTAVMIVFQADMSGPSASWPISSVAASIHHWKADLSPPTCGASWRFALDLHALDHRNVTVGPSEKARVYYSVEYQAMPSLRDVDPVGVLCTFSNRLASDWGKWCGPLGEAAITVHHVQNHTLLGHSPPPSRVGPALQPLVSLVDPLFLFTGYFRAIKQVLFLYILPILKQKKNAIYWR
jgi:hypothetical protein